METTTASSSTTRHFPGRHYEGTASGPFDALNPTVRRFPLAARTAKNIETQQIETGGDNDDENGDGDAQVNGRDAPAPADADQQAAAPPKDEIRADGVQRQWRSRDNRKGE